MSDYSGKSAPRSRAGSDSPPVMKGDKPIRASGPPWPRDPKGSREYGEGDSRCTNPRLATLLARYDDLDPAARAGLERHVVTCAECGPRWKFLVAADHWLASGEGRSGGRCPDAEELFDYGGGPGHRPVAAGRRAEIEAHLALCASCLEATHTLVTLAPVPWSIAPLSTAGTAAVGDPSGAGAPGGAIERVVPPLAGSRTGAPPAPVRNWRQHAWLPVAAAAAAALLFFLPNPVLTGPSAAQVASANEGAESLPFAYPSAQVLRGNEESALWFPRGPVLAGTVLARNHGSEWIHALTFELEPQMDAESYRVRLFRHGGGAFDEGKFVAEFEAVGANLNAGHLTLDPGHYTWEARMTVRGLERPLGERDFEVVIDESLGEKWTALEALSEPERGIRRVMLLHANGYVGDARAFARTLPADDARDTYLAHTPGR